MGGNLSTKLIFSADTESLPDFFHSSATQFVFLVSGFGLRRQVSFACVDDHFLRFPLLVCNHQRVAFVVHHFHFDLVIFAIARGFRRNVAQRILIAQEFDDGIENIGHFAFEAWKPGKAPRESSEIAHFIFRLKIANRLAIRIADLKHFGGSHAEDRDIGLLEHVVRLVERVLAEVSAPVPTSRIAFLPCTSFRRSIVSMSASNSFASLKPGK